jgi:transcription elongation GreA/GreB family factor
MHFMPPGVSEDDRAEREVTIVASDRDVGLWKLSPRTPLGGALLGHRAGDVVEVPLRGVRGKFEVMAVVDPHSPVAPEATSPALSDQEGSVRVGSMVRVRDGDLVEWWRIVPHVEADAIARRMSEQSPLALALLGNRVGDRVRVQHLSERRSVTILAVDAWGSWE